MNTEIIDLGKIGITLGYEYDNETIYEKLTIVLYKGKSYISTKTTKGVSPEQDIKIWQLVAEAKDAYHMLVDAGKTTLTEEEFLEQLADATKGRYIVQGNIINAADEEDLTVEHSDLLGIDTLKLANRDNIDGMGYIILRKNKSFAEQVTKENTIYEIKSNFDLNGEEITIPNNCILKFEGGSLYNGTIIGDNTIIDSKLNSIFDLSISLNGTFNVECVYAEWFGAKGDGINDDSYAINKALQTPITKLKLLNKVYLVENTTDVIWNVNNTTIKVNIIVPGNKIIQGCATSNYTHNSLIKVSKNSQSNVAIYIQSRQIKISDILISGSELSNNSFSCDKIICTNNLLAWITLDNVFGRDCNDICFDINAYIVKAHMCNASNCSIGFHMYSASGSNTTVNLLNCYANGCKINGYFIEHITYSTLISCACDSSGYDNNNIQSDSINHAYRFKSVKGISVISCGCEACYKVIKTEGDVLGLLIQSCYFLLYNKTKYPENFDFTDIYDLKYTNNTCIKYTLIGRDFQPGIIKAYSSSNIKIENSYLFKIDNTEKTKINQYHINVEESNSDFINNVIIKNDIGLVELNITTFSSILKYNYCDINNYAKFILNRDLELYGFTFSKINGNLKITSDNLTNILIPYAPNNADHTLEIIDCNDFTISNFKFSCYWYNAQDKDAILIKNSNVIFENIKFENNPTSAKIIKIINSNVTFKNCTFTPRPSYSSNFANHIDVDSNSTVNYKHLSIGTTEVRSTIKPLNIGFIYFDTVLNKPVWWTGTKWVDSTGTDV